VGTSKLSFDVTTRGEGGKAGKENEKGNQLENRLRTHPPCISRSAKRVPTGGLSGDHGVEGGGKARREMRRRNHAEAK